MPGLNCPLRRGGGRGGGGIHLGLFFGCCPFFLQQNLLWVSNWTVHSSVHTTSSKVSPWFAVAQFKRLALFTCLISWQYALPLKVQPSELLQRRIVASDKGWPLVLSSWYSWLAVVSSSLCICSSTICLTSGVIFEGLPLPGSLRYVKSSVLSHNYNVITLEKRIRSKGDLGGKGRGLPPWCVTKYNLLRAIEATPLLYIHTCLYPSST